MKAHRWSVVVAFLVLALAVPSATFAQQGFQVTAVTVGSGENPLSSGLTGTIQLTNEKDRFLEVTVQEEQAWVLYGPGFRMGKVSGIVAGSIGHFQGAPNAGIVLSLNVPVAENVSFSTLQWPGVFPWEPRDWKTENDWAENPERILKGYLGSVQMDVGPVGLVYSWQNFLDEPWNELPGVVYTAKVREDLSVSGSGIWNNNAEKWMFYIGATWRPQEN